jgi:hypothetical protein
VRIDCGCSRVVIRLSGSCHWSRGPRTHGLGKLVEKSRTAYTNLISTDAAGRMYGATHWGVAHGRSAGTAPNYVGDYMCTLGGYSGGRCDVVDL